MFYKNILHPTRQLYNLYQNLKPSSMTSEIQDTFFCINVKLNASRRVFYHTLCWNGIIFYVLHFFKLLNILPLYRFFCCCSVFQFLVVTPSESCKSKFVNEVSEVHSKNTCHHQAPSLILINIIRQRKSKILKQNCIQINGIHCGFFFFDNFRFMYCNETLMKLR